MRGLWLHVWSGFILRLRDWVDGETERLGPWLDEHYGERRG